MPMQSLATSLNASVKTPPTYWGGVLAMSLCVFSLVASEFMPVSLLTPIAADLNITEGMAGQAITVSGFFAVLTSLSMPLLAGRRSRKTLLLWMTVLMLFSGIVIASASNFTAYLAGRALIGIAIGGIWSMAAAVAMRLVPPANIPRALAIFNGGGALATVVAAPLGSYLGGLIGWRGAFFCLVPVALLALLWQAASLPAMQAEQRATGGNIFPLLKNPVVALGMAAVGALFTGQFTLFTYVRPFLETVGHVDVRTLSLILLAIGATGVVGTALIGPALKMGLYRALTAVPLLLAVIAVFLIELGSSLAAITVLLGLWGLFATAIPVGWWSWVAKTMPNDPEAGGGLMVAVIQLAIALGSTLGGILFDMAGYQSTFALSAGLLLLAALLSWLTARASSIAGLG